ncbi:MAG: GlsB/YeaQ/YmgE family stress response membrane protein [Saprospiraceae bacterium]|nr:GlsB/YeaQ/YmgE family stress response membrane protein [Saprospiraceae bacterium]
MGTNDLILTLIIGAVSGWLAGQIRRGYGFGLVGNIIVGIIGAFVGGWLFREVLHADLGGGLVGVIATSVIGALLLLFLIGLFKR